MAEVYMYIYNWQEKKEENQALEDFCHAPGPPNLAMKGGGASANSSGMFANWSSLMNGQHVVVLRLGIERLGELNELDPGVGELGELLQVLRSR